MPDAEPGRDSVGSPPQDTVSDVLTELRAFGSYFAVTGMAGDPQAWTSMAGLYEREAVLDELIRAVQVRLGDCELRVAASIFHLGVAARLLSPQIGCLYVGRFSLDLSRRNTGWRSTGVNFLELGIGRPAGVTAAADDLLIQESLSALMKDHLLPFTAALRRFHLAEGLLLGNIASAAVGAVRVLRPRLGAGWIDAAREVLAHLGLSTSGDFGPSDPAFVRRSCCLFYRVETGGYCGDCPIDPMER